MNEPHHRERDHLSIIHSFFVVGPPTGRHARHLQQRGEAAPALGQQDIQSRVHHVRPESGIMTSNGMNDMITDSPLQLLDPVRDEAPLGGHDGGHVQVVHARVDVALHESAAVVVLDEAHPPGQTGIAMN